MTTDGRRESQGRERVIQLPDGEMYTVTDGPPDGPVMVLIHGSAGCTTWWDPVVPAIATSHRVVRVDLLGHGRSADTTGAYDVPAQAGRVGEALDQLGVHRAVIVGHSMGCLVATALAAQNPDRVSALALIDMGPRHEDAAPDGLAVRLLLTPFPGRLLWRLRNERTIRAALRSASARPIDLPTGVVEAALEMSYRALAGTARGFHAYLGARSLDDRIAPLGLPLLVIFGVEDARYPSASVEGYRSVPGVRIEVLPGVGHTPMLEDPETTARLLVDFARSGRVADGRGPGPSMPA